jgi:hypothetical protein
VSIVVAEDLEGSLPSSGTISVVLDELLLTFITVSVVLLIVWGIKISGHVLLVLEYSISPGSTLAPASI